MIKASQNQPLVCETKWRWRVGELKGDDEEGNILGLVMRLLLWGFLGCTWAKSIMKGNAIQLPNWWTALLTRPDPPAPFPRPHTHAQRKVTAHECYNLNSDQLFTSWSPDPPPYVLILSHLYGKDRAVSHCMSREEACICTFSLYYIIIISSSLVHVTKHPCVLWTFQLKLSNNVAVRLARLLLGLSELRLLRSHTHAVKAAIHHFLSLFVVLHIFNRLRLLFKPFQSAAQHKVKRWALQTPSDTFIVVDSVTVLKQKQKTLHLVYIPILDVLH